METPRKTDHLVAAPTQLDLLSMSNLSLIELQQMHMDVDGLTGQVKRVVEARNNAHINLAHSGQRVNEYSRETYEDYSALSSSRTVSQMFLIIRNELLDIGASEEGVIDHFKRSLSTYLDCPELLMDPNSKSNKLISKLKGSFAKFKRPSGFTGSHEDWIDMLLRHVNATRLIHHYDVSKMHANPEYSVVLTCFPHRVRRDSLPEWMSELNNLHGEELVQLVEEEDQNDTSQSIAIEKSLLELRNQGRNIEAYYRAKIIKCDDWLKARYTNDLEKKSSTDLIFLSLNLEAYRSMVTDPNAPDPAEDGEKKVVDVLEHFVEHNSLKPETTALWLEKSFQKANFDQDNGLTRELLASVLRGMNSDNAMEILWHPLKEADKRLLRFLRYELGSLLSDVSPEELEILAQEVESLTTQEIIIELANTIRAHSQTTTERSQKDSNTSRVIKAIKNNGINWLTANYRWLQRMLYSRLQRQDTSYLQDNPQVEDNIEEVVTIASADSVFNPLRGWKIQYTSDMHYPEGDNLIDITGDSLDQIVSNLQKLVRKSDIAISVKVSSIVNCLGQIVMTPEDIERTIPHLGEHYSHVDYKKRKRGGMRILYRLDPARKTLVFFLHKKQAFHYKF